MQVSSGQVDILANTAVLRVRPASRHEKREWSAPGTVDAEQVDLFPHTHEPSARIAEPTGGWDGDSNMDASPTGLGTYGSEEAGKESE